MIPFCETWYCCISSWYWIILISGHVVLYSTAVHWYSLSSQYPSDNMQTMIIVTFVGSWLFSVWLPFSMILIRTERREIPIAIIFCIGCLLPIVFAATAFALTFFYPVDTNQYHKHMLSNLRNDILQKDDERLEQNDLWIDHVQQEKECCGLRNAKDYNFLKHKKQKPDFLPITCYPNEWDLDRILRKYNRKGHHQQNKTKSFKNGCLKYFIKTRDWYLLLVRIFNVWLILGCLVTLVIYSVRFCWIRNLPMVVLTGKVYVRVGPKNSDIKSYPEIDTSEAVSYSSSSDD